MLLQVRDFIRQQGVVSNQQIAREFRMDVHALQPMLDVWLRKGMIIECQQKTKCQSTCFKCRIQPPAYYQYVLSL